MITLIFCLMLVIQAAGQGGISARTPLDPTAGSFHPAIVTVNESIVSRAATLLMLINYARAEAGLQALQLDDGLTRAATHHASVMAQKGQLSHQFPEEPDLSGRLAHVRLDQAGENVVYDVTVQGAHEAFMGSRPHRTNVLDSAYNTVGIGIVENAGVIYVVEDFAHRVPDLKDDDAAERVAKQFNKLRQTAGNVDLLQVSNGQLQQITCSTAQRETPNGKALLALSGAKIAASYATVDPDLLPETVARLSKLKGIGHFSVSACYARTPKYPTGLYWLSIVLF